MNLSENTLFEEEQLDINITPLIDIVFLLLIFFMITTTFDESRGIKVKLPETNSASTQQEADVIHLSIKANKRIFLEEKEVSNAELEASIRKALAGNASSSLILRADKGVEHGVVVSAMDIAKSAGVKKIAIASIPK